MDASSLIIWLMGEVLIAVGVPLFYLGRYLAAPDGEKAKKARALKILAVVWMGVGVLIYIVLLARLAMNA